MLGDVLKSLIKRIAWLASVVALMACGTPLEDTGSPTGGAGVMPIAGMVGGAGSTGNAGTTATPVVAQGRSALGQTALPCDVAAILKLRCQSCHASTPVAGVPMSLTSWEDLTAMAVTRTDLKVHQLAAMRVHDATNPMPPTKPLPADELATLDAWFTGGAVAGTDPTCAPPQADADGGIPLPSPGPPPDSTCYTLRAHGKSEQGDTTPWMVSNQHYACFYFDQPWPDGAQGVYFAPELDENASLVHHFVMYLDQNGNNPDGFTETCTGLHPSGPTMIAGWAPGSDNNGLPPDVGMDVSPPNHKILMEIHFFHDGVSAPLPSTSGMKICVANKKLPNTATVSLLGSESIAIGAHAKGMAMGTCTPQFDGEIHVLRSWPHMHQMGTGMKTVVNFKDGTSQTLGPWPFDFNSQVSYSTPLVLKPGDKLTTTCEYDNTTDAPVSVGTDTKSEMCFNFVTAYPAGALKSKNILGGSSSATSAATACLQ